jgi:PAS domain S-box-containing protein
MSRTVRNRLAIFFVVVSACVTAYAWMDARYETITILRQREETEDALLGLLQSDNYGVALADEDGNILMWSNACELMTGWTASEMVGQPVEKVIPLGILGKSGKTVISEHRAHYNDAIKHPKNRQQLVVISCPIATKSGEEVPARIGVRIVTGRYGTVYAVANIDLERRIVRVKSEMKGGDK